MTSTFDLYLYSVSQGHYGIPTRTHAPRLRSTILKVGMSAAPGYSGHTVIWDQYMTPSTAMLHGAPAQPRGCARVDDIKP